jgi:tetratricopeptide (TPR) repeat protein
LLQPGLALWTKGDLEGAIRSCREAIRIDPKHANAHFNLGVVLFAKKDVEGAIRSFREAIRIAPKLGEAHGGLGDTLLIYGDFAGAAKAYGKVVELLPAAHPLSRLARARLAECKQVLAVEAKLAAVLEGKRTPQDAAQRIALADIARRRAKQLYVTAVGLYRTAFQAQPALARANRYGAACAAVQAGTGRGKEAGKLDDTERAHLRYAALGWLQSDLGARRRLLALWWPGAGEQSRQALQRWQQEADLAPVRNPALMRTLPEAEQVAWRNLWSQIDALLAPSRGKMAQ